MQKQKQSKQKPLITNYWSLLTTVPKKNIWGPRTELGITCHDGPGAGGGKASISEWMSIVRIVEKYTSGYKEQLMKNHERPTKTLVKNYDTQW